MGWRVWTYMGGRGRGERKERGRENRREREKWKIEKVYSYNSILCFVNRIE